MESVIEVLLEISSKQDESSNILRNGFTTFESKIFEAKKEIIENTDTKLDSSKYRTDETSSEEVYTQQGAKPKRKTEDIRHTRATCIIESEELDEESAVKFLQENKQRFPPDLCFNIIKAKRKCLLLELKAPSKILKDIESFRMALRALIIQVAHAGQIDINTPSTMTMKLIFTDDLTEDEIKVIKEISGQLFHSQRIVASANYPAVVVQNDARRVNIENNCKNCENLKTDVIIQQTTIGLLERKNRDLMISIIELDLLGEWQDRERSKLALENRQLSKKIHEALHRGKNVP
ncbi:unnamed protein product [Mytilus edulis]|uniref:Uncharacterized protein n=1 Tax=Mytilus edulis TaxID=6550 RepID=A0A8S3T3E6_MYTED|nr:unnamed protein product [Mytilus edulis]